MTLLYIVVDHFEHVVNDILPSNDKVVLVNNCSNDKRLFTLRSTQSVTIIHLAVRQSPDYIIQTLLPNHYEHIQIIMTNEDVKSALVVTLNNTLNYDTEKFNFDKAIKTIYQQKYGFNQPLHQLHNLISTQHLSQDELAFFNGLATFSVNDRKSVFILDFYTYVDSDPTFLILYKEFIIRYVKPLFPDEAKIIYQKTPNIRFGFPKLTAIGQLPTDPNPDVVGLHSDHDFNHSIQEINFIIPVTDMFDTNSIYYEPCVQSQLPYEKYENLKLKTGEFFMAYFNQLKHFNKLNVTGFTRISLDFRVIPFSKYSETADVTATAKQKLVVGSYFDVI